MRKNIARCVVAVLAATLLSGCSSGKLGMPNLAFWKRSPFDSKSIAAPAKVGSPLKPSALAANSGTTAPKWNPPNETPAVAVTPGTAYPSAQNPYQPTTPSYASNNAPAYVASNAGVPGAQAYGTQPPNNAYRTPTVPPVSAYNGANAYPSTTQPYNSTAASSNGYAPTGESYNPVRPASTYPNPQPSVYGGNAAPAYNNTAGTNRFSIPPAANANPPAYDAGNGTGNYTPPPGTRYDASPRTPPAATPNGYNNMPTAPTTPAYGGSRYDNTMPNYTGPSGAAPAATDNRYGSPDGNVPLVGNRYSSPSASVPNSSYGAGSAAPASSYSVPASNNATPAYRPGSTSDYTPITPGVVY